MNQIEWLLILGAVGFLLFSFIVILPYRMKKAIPKVIRTFREQNATNEKMAKTLEELGIKPGGIFDFRLLKDFKKEAVDLLMQAGVVEITEDDKYYLQEDKLISSKMYQFS